MTGVGINLNLLVWRYRNVTHIQSTLVGNKNQNILADHSMVINFVAVPTTPVQTTSIHLHTVASIKKIQCLRQPAASQAVKTTL